MKSHHPLPCHPPAGTPDATYHEKSKTDDSSVFQLKKTSSRRFKPILISLFFLTTLCCFLSFSAASSEEKPTELKLTDAVMCEFMKDFAPANQAVVFPISLKKIYCFTSFENIDQNTYIYHKWYHRDRFVASNRFRIKPPQWSTFSTMQLRVADKGPWRVEITDDADTVLKTLRFSVSDG